MTRGKRRVAITGLGVVSSLGLDIETFWEKLISGQSGISKISRFDPSEYTCQIAGEINNFDPSPWLSRKEVRRLDLFSQYALIACHNALNDASFDLEKEDLSRFGVILGSGMGGVTEVSKQIGILESKGPRRVSPITVPKVMVSAPCGEISIRNGFRGPNFVISSACTSSTAALGMAGRMIQWGESDVIVSGGSEAVVVPTSLAGFAAARALSTRNESPETASRPFDKDRNGFVMGEGSGIIILEEWERAKKRGAKIYAELCGAAWGSDAYHITEPAPDGRGAVQVMEQAMQNANIQANQISYINAHGTSTIKNDVMETIAIKKVFGDYAYQIPISSTKSLTGHLIGASGAIESIVCALSLSKKEIHGTANYTTPDPECDLDYVPEKCRQLPEVNYVLTNSFAFGGSNACLVLGKTEK